jgi:hypothetical protein
LISILLHRRLFINSFLDIYNNFNKDFKKDSTSSGVYQIISPEISSDFFPLAKECLSKNIKLDEVYKQSPTKLIGMTNFNGEKLIVKVYVNPIDRLYLKISYFIFGSFYRRLFLTLNRVFSEGCDVSPRCRFALERPGWLFPVFSLLILDYLPGRPLSDLQAGQISLYEPNIRKAFMKLHEHGLALMDVSTNNIVIDGDNVKIIDHSSNYPYYFGQTADVIKAKQRLGVIIPVRSRLLRLALPLFWLHRSALQFSRNHRIIRRKK